MCPRVLSRFEAQTGGLIGPVDLSSCHPTLVKMLSVSQPSQLWPPTRLGEWLVIVRLEKFIPAQLDNSMRQRLLTELFAAWLQEQLNQLSSVAVTVPALPTMLYHRQPLCGLEKLEVPASNAHESHSR